MDDLAKFAIWAKKMRYYPLSLRQRAFGLQDAQRGTAHLCECLQIYDATLPPLLTCGGSRFPIVVYPVSRPFQITESNEGGLLVAAKKEGEAWWSPTIASFDRSLYWLHRSQDDRQEDCTSFVMKQLVTQPDLRLHCGVSTFFTGLQTSQALGWEAYRNVGRIGEKARYYSRDNLDHFLPLRGRLLSGLANPLCDGQGRAATIAISVTLAYRHHGTTKALLGRRGERSIRYDRGKWHVIPAGMLQAPFNRFDREFSLTHCVYWEFFEELFNIPDPKKRRKLHDWFYEKGPVRELRRMLRDGSAELWATGIAVDVPSLRPEVLLLLFIKDENWFQRYSRGEGGARLIEMSDEVASPIEIKGNIPEFIIRESPDEFFKQYDLSFTSLVPAGAASLYLGIKALSEMKQ